MISSAVPTWVRLSGCFVCVAADGVSCVGVVWVRDGVRMDSVRLRHTHKRGPYLYAPVYPLATLFSCYRIHLQSTTIHTHKRYSAFVELYRALRQSLPVRPPMLSLSMYS